MAKKAESPYLTTGEVAKLYGADYPHQRIAEMCWDGRIPGAFQVGGRWLIPRTALKSLPPVRPVGRQPAD